MKRWLPLALLVLSFAYASEGEGADWPQYRCDANRSASSTEQLPPELNLQWVRRLPAPRPAFPGEVRLWFDASYEPVVLGRTMFVPSMVTDSVTALDTQTGAERWQFFAEGPVRFAPVAWEGNVCFVSDDGYLYCVNAADGKLRWKFHAIPPGKRDRKLLGSGRLVSLFPARGGPVLHNGVIYFGAGILNTYGVGVYAVDARSGKLIWSNTDSNRIPKANMDHGIAHEAGLSPQGYLAIVNDLLVVPCGAQLPAFLDLKTGRLKPYTMGWGGRDGLPKGTWFVAGSKNFLCHSGDLYDLNRPNDERFDEPKDCPDYDSRAGGRLNFKPMLYPGGFTRFWIDATNQKDLGSFQQPVFAADVLYTSEGGLAAYDLGNVQLEERMKAPIPPTRQNDRYPDKWTLASRELWRMPSKLRVQIQAGNRLYLGGRGVVEAVQLPQPNQEPQVVWQTAVEGTPHRMLAADGRLFVVTREGAIYAFGQRKKTTPVVFADSAPPSSPPDRWTKTAAAILQTTKIRDGYALVLGIGSGRLAEELVRQSKLDVIAIDRDAAKVDRFRRKLDAAGLYGTRASAHVGEPLSYPLAPYMASLVVSEDWDALRAKGSGVVSRAGGSGANVAASGAAGTGKDSRPPRREFFEAVFHLLRPYGGTACLSIAPGQQSDFVEEVNGRKLPGASVRTAADWVFVSRAGRLAGSADWSHAEADAANTGASADRIAKAPLELLWFDTPPRWFRTPGATLIRIVGGRMFLKAEKLDAVDVFTGRPLWQAELPFRHNLNDQMVAVDDAIYVAGGTTCLSLEPATGRTTARLTLPAELAGSWLNLRVCGNRLVGQGGKHLVCFDRHSGRLEWKYPCGRAGLSVACGGGKVFCAELPPPRGIKAEGPAKTHALDLETGKLVWQIAGGSEVRYSGAVDRVVLQSGIHRAEDGGLVATFPEPPKPTAKKPNQPRPAPLFVIGAKVLVGTPESYVEYDLQTGKALGKPVQWARRGCTIPRASANLVTTRVLGNAACIDLASREITTFWNVRAACANNLFPADGMLSIPSQIGGCTCNYLPISQAYVPASVIGRAAQP